VTSSSRQTAGANAPAVSFVSGVSRVPMTPKQNRLLIRALIVAMREDIVNLNSGGGKSEQGRIRRRHAASNLWESWAIAKLIGIPPPYLQLLERGN
jgi:hypothetical protein